MNTDGSMDEKILLEDKKVKLRNEMETEFSMRLLGREMNLDE
jgi:hypothetical protein